MVSIILNSSCKCTDIPIRAIRRKPNYSRPLMVFHSKITTTIKFSLLFLFSFKNKSYFRIFVQNKPTKKKKKIKSWSHLPLPTTEICSSFSSKESPAVHTQKPGESPYKKTWVLPSDASCRTTYHQIDKI